MAIPKWLERYVNEADLRKIEDAVGLAESRTAGEIVPMIVGSSSFVSHTFATALLVIFSALLLVSPLIAGHLWIHPVLWDTSMFLLSFVAAFALIRLAFVRRALTPWPDRVTAVDRRAQLEFYATGIPSTTGRTGILIFVSVFERRAVILGDEAISARLKPETWVEIIDELLLKIRAGRFADGMTETIAKVGEILAREFPIQPDDVNELSNKLVVKD